MDVTQCACRDFCEAHGRQHVRSDENGEFCNECAADGLTGELCEPSAESCFSGGGQSAIAANQRERQFMCAYHQFMHELFCEMAHWTDA